MGFFPFFFAAQPLPFFFHLFFMERALYEFQYWPLVAIIAGAMLPLAGLGLWILYRDLRHRIPGWQAAETAAVLESRVEMQDSSFDFVTAELHDNIGQKLAFAKLTLETLGSSPAAKHATQIQRCIAIVGEAMNDISSLCNGLRYDMLFDLGLPATAKAEIEKLGLSDGYDVEFNILGESVYLPDDRELVIFRVIQEALHNIVKHASASKIQLTLEYQAPNLFLTIKDNGKGFDSKRTQQKGMGLNNIYNRIRLMGGNSVVMSSEGAGTEIRVNMPYEDKNAGDKPAPAEVASPGQQSASPGQRLSASDHLQPGDIIFKLDRLMAREKMSVEALADLIGVNVRNLTVMRDGKGKAILYSTLVNLCRVLNCTPNDLFDIRKVSADDEEGINRS